VLPPSGFRRCGDLVPEAEPYGYATFFRRRSDPHAINHELMSYMGDVGLDEVEYTDPSGAH
jgi:hypothetical protein